MMIAETLLALVIAIIVRLIFAIILDENEKT